MYRARVDAVSGLKVLAGGMWLRCIGNRAVRAGDFVWTDGRCVYGHDQITQTPLVIVNPAEDMAIPLLFFDTVPTTTRTDITAAGYTLFPKPKLVQEYLDTASMNRGNNLFFVNNRTTCETVNIFEQSQDSVLAAVNLDNEDNVYALWKFEDRNTAGVNVVKNGQILREIECLSKVKEFETEMLKYARENCGGTVTLKKSYVVYVYDPEGPYIMLADDVLDVPPGLGGGFFGGLVTARPETRYWDDCYNAWSTSSVQDFGIPWGVIEDENNWAFMVTALIDAQATGYYESGGSAIPKNARVIARKTWIYTPTGAKDFYYSRFSRLDNNGTEIPSPKIEQSYPVSEPIPIQDGYYFTVNSAQLYWTAKYPMSDKQNAVMLNITVHDRDGGALWAGNVVAGTYLTICKNKKIWLGVDDRGGLGLYDHEFAYSGKSYSAMSGDLTSGVYLLDKGKAELIIGGYLKNQKLRPMKKYKNWWKQIEGGEESE